VITHRVEYLDRYDRVYFMQKGRIVDYGKWKDLKRNSRLVREFLNV